MKNPAGVTLVTCIILLVSLTSCKKENSQGNTLNATIIYRSSSLGILKSFKDASSGDLVLTPSNVTGEALSLLFATESEDDEGLVVFGDGRPDIAPADAVLIPFDFADPLMITSSISIKPAYVGGDVAHMVSTFGYIDIYVDIEGNDRVIRLALGHYDAGGSTYVRGDVLLQNTSSLQFEFYDLNNSVFTTSRPANPYVIEEIRDFSDPIRPNMVFYPLNIFLDASIYLDPAALLAGSSVDVDVNFDVEGLVVLINQASAINISDADIITSFDLSQNVNGFGQPGLSATAIVVINP